MSAPSFFNANLTRNGTVGFRLAIFLTRVVSGLKYFT